jgi:hypothetical protein
MAEQPYSDGAESSGNISVSDASDDLLDRFEEPENTLTVAIIAGSGKFEHDRARLSGQDGTITGIVADRLTEAGLSQPDTVVVPGTDMGDSVGQGYGVVYSKTADADLQTVEMDVSREETDDWGSDEWADAFRSRRLRVLEMADALLIVRNGESVGPYVDDGAQTDTAIYAPDYNTDDDDAEPADIEQSVQAVVSEVEDL